VEGRRHPGARRPARIAARSSPHSQRCRVTPSARGARASSSSEARFMESGPIELSINGRMHRTTGPLGWPHPAARDSPNSPKDGNHGTTLRYRQTDPRRLQGHVRRAHLRPGRRPGPGPARTGAPARLPDQRLRLLCRHARAPGPQVRPQRKSDQPGRHLEGSPGLRPPPARRPGLGRSRHRPQRPGSAGRHLRRGQSPLQPGGNRQPDPVRSRNQRLEPPHGRFAYAAVAVGRSRKTIKPTLGLALLLGLIVTGRWVILKLLSSLS